METDTSIIAKRAPKRYLFALFMCLLVEWSFTDYVQDKGHPTIPGHSTEKTQTCRQIHLCQTTDIARLHLISCLY